MQITIEGSSETYDYYFVPTMSGTASWSGTSADYTTVTVTISDGNAFTSGDTANDHFYSTTITGLYSKTTNGVTGTTFVGGIIGRVDSGVGNWNDTLGTARGEVNSSYVLGSIGSSGSSELVLSLTNSSAITGTYFVGGTIGAVLNNYGTNKYYNTQIRAILNNSAAITGNNDGRYIGGLVGSIGTIDDTAQQNSYNSLIVDGSQGSLNGPLNTSTEIIIGNNSSLYFVGGVAGFINANTTNQIIR